MNAKNLMAEAVAKSRREEKPKPEKIYNANATPARRGKRGLTLYLAPEAHMALKRVALQEDKKINELLLDGVNYILQRYGEKPIA